MSGRSWPSLHGSHRRKQWSFLKEEMGDLSREVTPSQSEHVMKLPMEDMQMFGRIPAWENFTLVTCEKCEKVVKIEAFESHVMLRHGSKSERSAYHKQIAAKAAAALHTVRLTPALLPDSPQGQERMEVEEQNSSFSDNVVETVEVPSYSGYNSSFESAGPSSPQVGQAESSCVRSPTHAQSPSLIHSEKMDTSPDTHQPTFLPEPISQPSSPQPTLKQTSQPISIHSPRHTPSPSTPPIPTPNKKPTLQSIHPPTVSIQQNPKPTFVSEEADSTTNNVISIPDTEDLPNIQIGILSEGQVTGAINTTFDLSPPPSHLSISVDSTSSLLSSFCPPPRPPQIHRVASPTPLSCLAPEPMEFEQTTPPVPTHYITVSPLSKSSLSPTKLIVGRVSSGPTPVFALPERKPTGREREYDPNKHCGVWDAEALRHCTRSLTCKSHSVYLKRKVLNRNGPFDDLLAAHKAEKEAANVKMLSTQQETGSSILEQRLKLTTIVTPTLVKQEVPRGNIQLLSPTHVKVPNKDVYCEDTLHYTTDHPKPLAVCSFGGKRMGGLFIADRTRLFTRRVVNVALANSNFSKTAVRQQALPYVVNFPSGMSGIQGRLNTFNLAGTSQPKQIIVQEAFKTDIQDLKGGIKFELGQKIHLNSPSAGGSEGPG